MRIRQSVCLPMLKPADMPLRQFLPSLAGIGFEAVEIWNRDEHFEELTALCRQYGLKIACMIGHGHPGQGLNDAARHEQIEVELRASIDLAALHGIPGLICFSGNRRDGADEREAMEAAVAGLRRVAPYAEDKGVNLNLELLNSKIDHPGYQCDHTAWGVEVCERVGSPRVKLLYDIYHMQVMEGDVIRTIRDNIRWIGHFHIAGVPDRQDPDCSQELNYAAVCAVIAGTGYGLFVGHEFKSKADSLQSLRAAYVICDRGEEHGK